MGSNQLKKRIFFITYSIFNDNISTGTISHIFIRKNMAISPTATYNYMLNISENLIIIGSTHN